MKRMEKMKTTRTRIMRMTTMTRERTRKMNQRTERTMLRTHSPTSLRCPSATTSDTQKLPDHQGGIDTWQNFMKIRNTTIHNFHNSPVSLGQNVCSKIRKKCLISDINVLLVKMVPYISWSDTIDLSTIISKNIISFQYLSAEPRIFYNSVSI